MALKPCDECKHAIRSEDRVCSHCGRKQFDSSKSNLPKVALVVFALAAGVWVFDATSPKEPEKQIEAAARPTPVAPKTIAVAPLSELERTLQERCGKQTDDNGNWIVSGAETRARCRVQVELEIERAEREARALAAQHAIPMPAVREPAGQHEAPRMAQLTRPARPGRARMTRHEPSLRSATPPVINTAPNTNVVHEPERPAPAKEAGGAIGPGDDLQPLVPAAGALNRDPVPGEPMSVKPDAAFL